MTDNEKIILLQTMTDETDQTVLTAYLTFAKQVVFENAFPYGDYPEQVPTQYDAVHVEIAAYMINKRGGEGETSHTENGVKRGWENASIPASLIHRITPIAKPM